MPTHFTPDELEAWITGSLADARAAHMGDCGECRHLARAERELAELLGALPQLAPSAGFADRVMSLVRIPDPFSLRAAWTFRERLMRSPRTLALAASVLVTVLVGMGGSIVWTLNHPEWLTAIGREAATQAAAGFWLGLRTLGSNLLEQPWFAGFRDFIGSPTRLALASAALSLVYLSGILVLRRLLALPARRVAHAQW